MRTWLQNRPLVMPEKRLVFSNPKHKNFLEGKKKTYFLSQKLKRVRIHPLKDNTKSACFHCCAGKVECVRENRVRCDGCSAALAHSRLPSPTSSSRLTHTELRIHVSSVLDLCVVLVSGRFIENTVKLIHSVPVTSSLI